MVADGSMELTQGKVRKLLPLAAIMLLASCGARDGGAGQADAGDASSRDAPASTAAVSPAPDAPMPQALDTFAAVVVNEAIPSALFDIRYHTANNFTGAKVDGYNEPLCLLTEPAAAALMKVQKDVNAQGRSLKIFDCFRPQRAVDRFVRWARDLSDQAKKAEYYPAEDKSQLFEKGYIADRSGHSRGSTLDLTLVRLSDATELDMGTAFDYFDSLSNTADPRISEQQRANRLLLKEAMEKHGFVNYDKEWWHYTLAAEPHPDIYFDFPVQIAGHAGDGQ